ncbi:MAG: hypothetical protein RH942_18735 [Kiloniellaceae bacterium]
MSRSSFKRVALPLTLCAALAAAPSYAQRASDQVTYEAWLNAIADLKNGSPEAVEAKREKVEQGCVLDLYREDGDRQIRETVAGLLGVAKVAAFRVFCRALVQAVVGDRLTAADFRLFLDDSDNYKQSLAAGRVIREVFYAHEDLLRSEARGGPS